MIQIWNSYLIYFPRIHINNFTAQGTVNEAHTVATFDWPLVVFLMEEILPKNEIKEFTVTINGTKRFVIDGDWCDSRQY